MKRCMILVVPSSLAVVPMSLIRRLGMGVGVRANIAQRAGAGQIPAWMSLVTLRMIDDLFPRVSKVASDPIWAHIHVAIFGALQRLDAGTHQGTVVVDERIAAQPASIDVDVSESAK
jgi:hypothetical protein